MLIIDDIFYINEKRVTDLDIEIKKIEVNKINFKYTYTKKEYFISKQKYEKTLGAFNYLIENNNKILLYDIQGNIIFWNTPYNTIMTRFYKNLILHKFDSNYIIYYILSFKQNILHNESKEYFIFKFYNLYFTVRNGYILKMSVKPKFLHLKKKDRFLILHNFYLQWIQAFL